MPGLVGREHFGGHYVYSTLFSREMGVIVGGVVITSAVSMEVTGEGEVLVEVCSTDVMAGGAVLLVTGVAFEICSHSIASG